MVDPHHGRMRGRNFLPDESCRELLNSLVHPNRQRPRTTERSEHGVYEVRGPSKVSYRIWSNFVRVLGVGLVNGEVSNTRS